MSDEAPKKKTRTYHSPRRQEQAIITRDRIVAAALSQLQEKGYADMTLESIARDAGVAPQTVYAVCGSKKGVLAAILENSVEAQKYDRERDLIMQVKTGEERVQAMGHFLSLLLESSGPAFQLMRGLGVLSPELADVELDYEMMIYEKNTKQVQQMASDGLLRSGLDVESATDMLWAVSAPGVHRRLIQLRGWTAERYEEFMSRLFACLLLNPEAASRMLHRDVSPFSENEPWKLPKDDVPANTPAMSSADPAIAKKVVRTRKSMAPVNASGDAKVDASVLAHETTATTAPPTPPPSADRENQEQDAAASPSPRRAKRKTVASLRPVHKKRKAGAKL